MRRNRFHLRPTQETFENFSNHAPDTPVDDEDEEGEEEHVTQSPGETNAVAPAAPTEVSPPVNSVEPGVRRSGRSRVQTQFYQAGM